MRKMFLSAVIGASFLGLAACGGDNEAANQAGTAETNDMTGDAAGSAAAPAGGGTAAAAADPNWPTGTRIVEEGGVTYRIDPDGTRVRLDDSDVRIVTDNGVRYRVNREGTRFRIDERGLDVDLDGPDIPGVDVDLGTNSKGNLDLDVSTNGTDASPER